jgi:hypothetical protein
MMMMVHDGLVCHTTTTQAGANTFNGFELSKTAEYISRVNTAFIANVWAIPKLDLTTGVADGFDAALGGWNE